MVKITYFLWQLYFEKIFKVSFPVLKAIKDTAVKNEALIDDFTGFDVQAEGTVLRLDFATQSAWRTLAAELKEDKGLRDGIYEVLRTKYPALKQAFFYSKSPY